MGTLQRVRDAGLGSSLRAQLLRGGLGSLVIKATNVALTFAVGVILARTLGAGGYGVYAFAMAAATFLAIPAQGGVPQVVLRETAKAQAQGNWALMSGLWRWGTGAFVVLSASVVLIGYTILFIAWEHIDRNQGIALSVAVLLIPLMALVQVLGFTVRGLGRVLLGQLPPLILRPGLLVVGIAGVVVWAPEELSPQRALMLHGLALALTCLIALWLLRVSRPRELKYTATRRTESRRWLGAALPLALTSGLQNLNNQADMLVLGVFHPGAEVGIYRAVVQGGILVGFGLTAINQVFAPNFSRMYASGDLAQLQKLVTRGLRVIILIAAIPAVTFILVGEELLALVFGESFGQGYVALLIVVLGQFVNAFFGPVGMLMNMTGHERTTMVVVASAAVVNIALNFTLVPIWGMEGAAISTALTMVLWNIVLSRAVFLRLGIRSSPFG